MFIDEHAEAVVLEVEETVEEMTHDESPLGDSQTASTAATTHSRRFLLNQEYIKVRSSHLILILVNNDDGFRSYSVVK